MFKGGEGGAHAKNCEEISEAVLSCIGGVSEIIKKGIKEGLFNGDDPWKISWVIWSQFVGIGHLNEARQSLDEGKNDFESLFDFSFRGLIIKDN